MAARRGMGSSVRSLWTDSSLLPAHISLHRDIKPHNLLLTARGHLLLTDFGSAAPLFLAACSSAELSAPPNSIARKYARALVGTPDYIAPEILHNAERVVQDFGFDESDELEEPSAEVELQDGEERAYGCEVDWWSVGVTLYEVSTV